MKNLKNEKQFSVGELAHHLGIKTPIVLELFQKIFTDAPFGKKRKLNFLELETHWDEIKKLNGIKHNLLQITNILLGYLEEKEKPVEDWEDDDWYDDYDEGRARALEKNTALVGQLLYNRSGALGIGTNKLKRRLNKLAESNTVAKAVRLALEIEDVNINAKKYFGKYRQKHYDRKSALIKDLIVLFVENKWLYGWQSSDVFETSHVVFFEIPGCEQISWHSTIDIHTNPKYEKQWDGKVNSTFDKLLTFVENNFPEILKK